MIDSRRVHLIDTPGFDDTDLKDADILGVIARYLVNSNPDQPIRLSGIIYLHRICDIRIGGTARKDIKLFRSLVGEDNMRNVALVTTMWGKVDGEQGQERERELISTSHFWGSMKRAGAKCDRYDDTRPDGLRIIRQLLRNIPCSLQIQREMENGATLAETTAGKEVDERINQLEAQYKNEIEELKMELEGMKNRDDIEELRREQARAMEKVEEAQRARGLMQSTIERLQGDLQHWQDKGSWQCRVM